MSRGGQGEAELVLTTREGVLKGGEVGPAVNLEDPASSLMLQMVSYKDDDHQMPPIGKLPQAKIDLLAKWIEVGLPFPKEDEIEPKIDHSHARTTEVNEFTKSHWAFKPPVDHDVPPGKDGEHPIDRFIRQKLDKENLPSILWLQTMKSCGEQVMTLLACLPPLN